MSRDHVSHGDIAKFAQEKVNLPQEKSREYRAQARRLREKVESHLKAHPDFSIKKLMISGSLAKGTALRSLNDIDLACYISGKSKDTSIDELLDYMVEKLQQAFPNFSPDQVVRQTYSICVSFRGSGLDVDIVPIIYDGDPDWYGDLVSQDDGSFLKTSIPRHIDFMKSRKDKHPEHYAQVIRLAKYWARKEKREKDGFRFKSFMIELIFAKLSDNGCNFSDYPEALQEFFTYIAKSDLNELIFSTDYFALSEVGDVETPVKIIDPVNPENNVSQLYTTRQREMIVDAALDAGDAIDSALAATTKGETVRYWQKVFGSTFNM